jgi:hypothetical protein
MPLVAAADHRIGMALVMMAIAAVPEAVLDLGMVRVLAMQDPVPLGKVMQVGLVIMLLVIMVVAEVVVQAAPDQTLLPRVVQGVSEQILVLQAQQ